ncbi:MAG: hypothetical protein IT343_07310 [Candidatus Melainabacteria bacterium]|nr:hypothetical protein [Candidatus Melainabacteria bacterium]
MGIEPIGLPFSRTYLPPPEKPPTNENSNAPAVLKPWQQGYRFDLNGNDGNIIVGNVLLGENNAAPAMFGKPTAADRHLPATSVEERPPQAQPLSQGLVDPALRAFTARFAYLAATDSLTANNGKITDLLKKSGPVGEQLLAKMADMEQSGWKIRPLSFNDRYMQLEKPNFFSRLAKMGTLSGYHYDYFKGEQLRTVAYNNVTNALGGVMGSNYGAGTPLKRITGIVSHELAHHDGTLADIKNAANLPRAEQQTLAKRLLATETRAVLTQLHISDKIGDRHITDDVFKAALRKRDLGGLIYDAWGKSGSTYASFGSLDRKYANTFVNEFIDDLSAKTQGKFATPLIDMKTGKVGVFDINEGIGNRFGAVTGDDELMRRMQSPTLEKGVPAGRFAGFFESKTGRAVSHGMKGVAAIGLISTAADLKGAYGESFAKGNSRLARVGVDWAGFEAGTALGSKFATALTVASKVRVPMAAIPLVAIAAGIGGSYLADKYMGESVENYLSRKVE